MPCNPNHTPGRRDRRARPSQLDGKAMPGDHRVLSMTLAPFYA